VPAELPASIEYDNPTGCQLPPVLIFDSR